MNKKISTSIAIIIIIGCALLVAGITAWQYLGLQKKEFKTIETEVFKEEKEEIDKDIILTRAKENIEKIKTVHAKEEKKEYYQVGGGELREDYLSIFEYDFVFPDKIKISSTPRYPEPEELEYGKDETIIIGNDIYRKFSIFETAKNTPPYNQLFEKAGLTPYQWIHGKEGEFIITPVPYESYQDEDKLYFSRGPDAWNFTRNIETIEEDLGIEEINGVKYHHYKVKYKEFSLEHTGVGIYSGIVEGRHLIIDVVEEGPAQKAGLKSGDEIMEINGVSTLGLSKDEITKRMGGPEGTDVVLTIYRRDWTEPKKIKITRSAMEIKGFKGYIGDVVPIFQKFRQEGDIIRIFKYDKEILIPIPNPEVITAPIMAVSMVERGVVGRPNYYTIDTLGITGEIWVGKDDLFVHKEKIITEENHFAFDAEKPEEERTRPIYFTRWVSEIVYSDFNKDIEIKAPTQGVITTSEFSKKIESVYKKK